MKIEEKVAHTLIASNKTLAVAESCSGGLLLHRLTNVSGSSQFLKLGLIVYSNEAKIKLLKIKENLITTQGAVSEDVALAMATNVRKLYQTDYGIGITGIAGPTGGTIMKPIGLVFIAVSSALNTTCFKFLFKGDRNKIKSQSVNQALKILLNQN